MAKDPKQELLKLLDEISATKKKINELEASRRKLLEEVDSDLQKAYIECDTLYEKKRIIEQALIDEMVYDK
jgi:cell division protein FtsB